MDEIKSNPVNSLAQRGLMGSALNDSLGLTKRQIPRLLVGILLADYVLISIEFFHCNLHLHRSMFGSKTYHRQQSNVLRSDLTTNIRIFSSFYLIKRSRTGFFSLNVRAAPSSDSGSNSTASQNSSSLAALCIVPPERMWPAIQSIRKVHDKRFRQWFPNIPLIFPLLRSLSISDEVLLDAAQTMAPVLARFTPFQVACDASPERRCLTLGCCRFQWTGWKLSSTGTAGASGSSHGPARPSSTCRCRFLVRRYGPARGGLICGGCGIRVWYPLHP